MKECPDCKRTLPLSEFGKCSTRKDGVYYYCRSCAAERSRKNYAKRMQNPSLRKAKADGQRANLRAKKAEAVAKLGNCCADCGGVFHQCQYDFHHLDPTVKEGNPSEIFRKADWEAEIEKCVLLCANCHRLRHFKEDE